MNNQTTTPETKIFNLVILDESGSMHSIKKQAIDGVNETIQCMKKAQTEHPVQKQFFTLVTFNDNVTTVCNCIPADSVKEIGNKDYKPNSCTALYDAIGFSANNLRSLVGENDKVLVTIVTDGYENASREYSGNAIKSLIDDLKKKNWIFTYMGANHDVEKAAINISITNTMKFEASEVGTSQAWDRFNERKMEFYNRVRNNDFNAEEENKNFFKA